MWHGGQGGVKLAGNRNARDRTDSFQGSEVSLGDEIRNSLSFVLQPSWNKRAQGSKLRGKLWAAELGEGWIHRLRCPMQILLDLVMCI